MEQTYDMNQKEKELAMIEMKEFNLDNGSKKCNDEEAQLDQNDETKKINKYWETTKMILDILLRTVGVLLTLYVFIIALDLMSTGFRMTLGLEISQLFRTEAILQSPITGLIIGIIVTVVVQSSSASTSIVVSLVASGAIPEIKYAIPIIMGANIGTSVTSTLVALTQAKNSENFGRAFAGGTVHDAFNLLSVIVLLPVEMATGYLRHLSEAMTAGLGDDTVLDASNYDIFDKIKKPVTEAIIQIDKSLLDKYANPNYNITGNETFLKTTCKAKYDNGTTYNTKCYYFFGSDLFDDWSENTIGIVLTVVSLALVIGSLIVISQLLASIFKGPVAIVVNKIVNAEPKNVILKHLIGYVGIILGCGFTFILQSSSVFTSSLVPLVGLGVISLERVFPLTLGSNIGTTITGIIAALGQSTNFRESIEIAICHTFFNITGIIIWYPLPFMRRAPLAIARYLGRRAADHKWFAIAYLIVVFGIIPGVLLGFALISDVALYIFFGLCVLLVLAFVAVNLMQIYCPRFLPPILRTWDFMPYYLKHIFCGLKKGETLPSRSASRPVSSKKIAPMPTEKFAIEASANTKVDTIDETDEIRL